METIRYVSDFVWFSGKVKSESYKSPWHAYSQHLNYIGRKDENIIVYNLNKQLWHERVNFELSKRKDSRFALSFVLALPNFINNNNVYIYKEKLLNFLAKQLNVPTENITLAFHFHGSKVSNNLNHHVHVEIYPRDKNGKKLRIGRKELKKFHEEWDNFLKNELNVEIKKLPETLKIEHLGTRLHYDKDAQELYREYRDTVQLYWKVQKLKNERKTNNDKEITRVAPDGALKEREDLAVKEKVIGFWEDFMMNGDFKEKQEKVIREHIERLGYDENDKVAIVLVNHEKNKAEQYVWTVKEIFEKLKFLRKKNVNGYSVYMSVNTLKDDAVKRRKVDFKEKQKRIYLDFDSKDFKRPSEKVKELINYLKVNNLPAPTHIVKSSKGNFQIYWLLDEELDVETLEQIMKKLNDDLALDHTQDVSRVFRLPYFRNKKPGKDELVVNVKRLKVKDEVLETTGKSVKVDSFLRLLDKPEERLKAKELNVHWQPVKDEEKRMEVYSALRFEELKKNANEKTYDYWKLANVYFDERLKRKNKHLAKELKEIFERAYEKHKDKSASEIDMSFTISALYKGYDENLIRETLQVLADWRETTKSKSYADLTIEKAKQFIEKLQKEEEIKRENVERYKRLKSQKRKRDNGLGFNR